MMTVQDLRNVLRRFNRDWEVRLAIQPSLPIETKIRKLVLRSDFEDLESVIHRVGRRIIVPRHEDQEIVYLVQGNLIARLMDSKGKELPFPWTSKPRYPGSG